MTNQEAIEILSQIMDMLLASNSWLPSTDNPIKESFGMAINALNAQPETHDKRTETHACDCISRQAAIDALDGEIEITGRTNAEAVKGYVRLVKDRLERLPSAQSDLSSYSDKLWRNAYERGREEAEAEIIRCKDCKWKQGAECTRFAEVRPFPNDFCSRAERRTDGFR